MKLTQLFLIFYCACGTIIAQNNPNNSATPKEIIQWLNAFEDRNSPERIMQGTLKDKVNLEFENNELIINSMIWRGSNILPLMTKERLIISDISRIEALKTIQSDFTIVDIIFYSKKGSILIECKEFNDINYSKCTWEERYFLENGYTSSDLRFKFPNNIADDEINRVYRALQSFFNSHGLYPEIGSSF
jgi:hypothetical protein